MVFVVFVVHKIGNTHIQMVFVVFVVYGEVKGSSTGVVYEHDAPGSTLRGSERLK